MRPISVVILDDDIAMAGIQLQRINSIDGFSCTQLFTNAHDLLNSKISPDIILLDLVMADLDGLTVMPLLMKKFPNASVVIHSNNEDIGTILESISLGAVGYIDKTSFHDSIESVLKNVQKEGAYITPKIARRIFDFFQHSSSTTNSLTQRELQVAYLIKEGHSYKQVGERCGISVDTVRMHIRNIYRKLEVNSKVQLANRISKSMVLPIQAYAKISA